MAIRRKRKRTIQDAEAELEWMKLEHRRLKIEVAQITALREAWPGLTDRIRLNYPMKENRNENPR